jgi:hypothetical protein
MAFASPDFNIYLREEIVLRRWQFEEIFFGAVHNP